MLKWLEIAIAGTLAVVLHGLLFLVSDKPEGAAASAGAAASPESFRQG